ncbi:MAG TPA: hydrogen peroxide-dependent heme synthase [Candidatus Limnocylindrales bacterium]|nr:hydrogen peroxide-dependent heme synthase [Candidatus Limnocylindrales bacterium]
MPEFVAVEAPQTLEGWYTLHDVYALNWPRWRARSQSERKAIAEEASAWLGRAAAANVQEAAGRGDSKLYSVVSQKGDLLFCHYRQSPAALNEVELTLRTLRLYEFLSPAYSYLSVIEVSLYEVQAMAARRLAERGLKPGTTEYDQALTGEMETQKARMNERLFRTIPPQRYICFYPMSKRRGESVNWYALPLAERRAMMRGHGSIGHKWSEQVTQVIGGSVGLDDWEWGVSLHADDPLAFKKLVYEMRFDPTTSWFGEFGPFYVGVRVDPPAVEDLLEGRLPDDARQRRPGLH